MQEWELLDRSVTGPKGELLQPRQPMVIEEEEVPRGGATLERRWQSARWTDGSLHVWLQRTKRLGSRRALQRPALGLARGAPRSRRSPLTLHLGKIGVIAPFGEDACQGLTRIYPGERV